MAQVAIDVIGKVDYSKQTFTIDPEKLNDVVVNFKLGSVLNTPPGILLTPQQWNQVINDIQSAAQKTRLKIPVLYGLDDIHGVNYAAGTTLFPQQIGQAATWNRQLIYDAGVITAYEGRAVGVPWTFSPVLDLGTNPQWPRIWEGYGEDPYLSSELGVQFTKGVQDPLGSKEKLVVSLKHYMAYSDPKSGHDRTDAWIPEHYLREYHLPGFAAGIRAGARTVMVNSALINGIPGHINKHVLTDILKNELKFTGFVVTDWQDIENIYRRDKIAKTMKEAVMLAINAGIDMSMIPYNYKQFCTDLIALAKEGKVSMFGSSLLVNPVYQYKQRTRQVYLPKGVGWYDIYKGQYFDGGKEINANAPYERMPVFVKEGSIIPFGPELQYTSEKPADTISLFVYTGRNSSFDLYEDEGTNYNYEKGSFSTMKMVYDEQTKSLTLQNRRGQFPGMLQRRVFNIVWVTKNKMKALDFNQPWDEQIVYEGKQKTIKMK